MIQDELFSDLDPELERMSQKIGGVTSWSARAVAIKLGYKGFDNFKKGPLKKAQQAFLSLEIDLAEHFQLYTADTGKQDYRISRQAFYFCVMNSDPTKKEVAEAQAYFATFADFCLQFVDDPALMERVLVREKVSEQECSLKGVVEDTSEPVNYGLFRNAAYRGLYNMNLSELKSLKGVPSSRTPLDFMGKTELATNLFQLTQTEDKIKNENIKGQKNLEDAAIQAGMVIRGTISKLSGDMPEDLPAEEDIKKVRKGLKNTVNGLAKVDSMKS